MTRLIPAALVVLAASGACGAYTNPEPETRPRPADVAGFAAQIEDDLQVHDWQSILVDSDPEYYRSQVVEIGISEPLYVAELFGLHEQGNDIQEGETLEWEDLERITSVRLEPVGTGGAPTRLTGTAGLQGGATLRLEAWVTQIRGRFVLTHGIG